MEEVIEKLNNTLAAKKVSYPITIKGNITNTDGTFVYRLNEPLNLPEDGTYLVWLWNFTGWSNFPNVETGINDKFYYSSERSGIRKITVPTSLQSVDSYNAFIQEKMKQNGDVTERGEYPIDLSADVTTQRIVMSILEGFHVYFDRGQTWKDRLGFKSSIYGKGVHIAENRADILKTLNAFIESNISYGWSFEGNRTNILYAIVNNTPPGVMIVERPNPPIKVLLNKYHIDEITLKFYSDDKSPVTFQGEEFVLNLVIERQ